MNQIKEVINTENAPQAIGPYSQAIKTKPYVFVSGQIPLDSKNGSIVGNDIVSQTHQVIQNIENILKEVQLNLTHVVKTTVFLTDMNLFLDMNHIYGQYFQEKPPARACVEVAKLPKGVLVEIDAIAFDPS